MHLFTIEKNSNENKKKVKSFPYKFIETRFILKDFARQQI